MARQMTKEEVRAWKERWRLVNAYERAEHRATPIEVKLEQTAGLMVSGRGFGWLRPSSNELTEVRERWARLKRRHDG